MLGPLAGFTVGITGDRRSEEQGELLHRRGAQVVQGPVMRTRLLSEPDVTLTDTERALEGADVVVLTTGIGTRSWFGVAEMAGLDDRLRDLCAASYIVARGPKARGAARAHGVEVAWEAPNSSGVEVLAHLESVGVSGKRVVVQRDGGEPRLAAAVSALGAEVVDVAVYCWDRPVDEGPAVRLLDAATGARLHAVTFTCPHAVDASFEMAPDPVALRVALNGPVVPVAIGAVTAGALRDHGIDDPLMPERPRLGAMVQSLVQRLADDHRTLRTGDVLVRWQGDLLVLPDGTQATLTPGERRVLRELLRRAPAVVPKRALTDPGTDEHAAEAAVGRLRVKLGPLAAGVRTVPRRGYSCTLEEAPVDLSA